MSVPDDARLFDLIYKLSEYIQDAKQGLPEEVFLLISRLTPLVNVDLLIRDQSDRVLLTWRDDQFYGPGWHVPGGIIRFKESAAERIAEVARVELGTEVEAQSYPCLVSEIQASHRDERGHFISLLYQCALAQPLDERLEYRGGRAKNGFWSWFSNCPDNLIPQHETYRAIFIANNGLS